MPDSTRKQIKHAIRSIRYGATLTFNQPVPDDSFNRLMFYQFILGVVRLFIAGLCIYLGYYLFVSGICAGEAWDVSLFGFNSKLEKASPGAILIIAGLILAIFTRLIVKQTHR